MKGINSMDVRGLKLKPTRRDRYHYFNTVEVGDLAQLVGLKAQYLDFVDLTKEGWKMNGKVISKSDVEFDGEVEIEFWNYDRKYTRSFDSIMRCTEKLTYKYDVKYHFYWWILPYQAECYQKVRNWYWRRKEPRTPAEICKEIAEARTMYAGNRQLKSIIGKILAPNTEAFETESDEIEF
jgi:hypothetical protein